MSNNISYCCFECHIQLNDWEMFLNEKYSLGHLYCENCQTHKERVLIYDQHEREKILRKQLCVSVANSLDFYDYKKHDLVEVEEDLTGDLK